MNSDVRGYKESKPFTVEPFLIVTAKDSNSVMIRYRFGEISLKH
jgi:hypothetical protein